MKKYIAAAALVTMLGLACKKQATFTEDSIIQESGQRKPVCGMEEAMAGLSPEMREAIAGAAIKADAQAAELLLFLDFDGAIIRPGFPNATGLSSPIVRFASNCPSPALTGEEIERVVQLVADDYSPFHIVVTTDQAVFNTYPAPYKQICIVTTFPAVIGMGSGVGGVSPFSGLGSRLPFNPSFVFAGTYGNNPEAVAAVISHESGHGMGLGHQHQFNDACNFLYEYHSAFGTGPLSFAPIMGEAEGGRVANWYAQTCPSPVFGSAQNDFGLLNSQVVQREDDFPDEPSGNDPVSSGETAGILEEDGDADYILVQFKKPGPVTVSSDNIDLKVSVYSPGGHLMSVHNDPDDTGVTIEQVNGRRFLKIEAAGNANMPARFMTGKYKIIF